LFIRPLSPEFWRSKRWVILDPRCSTMVSLLPMQGFPALEPAKKTGQECLHDNSRPLGFTLLDFWRWATSDLVSNATRGLLAEYLRNWDAATNLFSDELKRQADLYAFCLLAHQDKATLDPLNVSQWEFYIVRSSVLDVKFPAQKSIGLAALVRVGVLPIRYDKLKSSLGAYEKGDG